MGRIRKSILLVEDQRDLADVVKRHLLQLDYDVHIASDGRSAITALESRAARYDLVLLDLMLPGIDGLEVCRKIRGGENYIPIIMLTAKSTELDKVVGLEVGADDYLTKPFSIKELLARVKAIFRTIDATSDVKQPAPISIGNVVTINPETRTVIVRGNEAKLTSKEFDLLLHFASNPGRVYSREQLLKAVWGHGHRGYDHAVNCHINRLRGKIEKDQSRPEFITTVWGVGYKLAVDVDNDD